MEQLERERERKIREQQKEQREQKERERRAEERRKEREARREGNYLCINVVWAYCLLTQWWNGGVESIFLLKSVPEFKKIKAGGPSMWEGIKKSIKFYMGK